MAFTTIESSELVDKGVSGLSDTPDIEASDLKERFDSLGKLAIQKFQTHINELEANTASGSIGANVPAGLNASSNIQSLLDAMYLLIKELKEYQHTHSNRDTLELITADVKESYDRLATVFNTISEIENVVTDNASKIPTSAAIVKLTQDIYANKNVEALQAVEAAEAAQAETESVAADLREYAETVHNAISNLGRTADDTLREATRTAERVQSAISTAESSANDAKNYAEQAQEAWERISNSGSTGVPGADGKSAYELAVDNGFSGTLAEWLNSLKGDSIPNYFAGKSAIAFGTSITMRCSQYDNGGYVGVVKDILGLSSYVNNGMDGFSIAVRSGIGIVKTIESASNLNSYDLITIEGGTNDFRLNLPLGEVGEMGDSSFDKTTFCGALRSAIEHILTAKPSAYIVLIADPQRNNAGYDVNYVNSAGYKLMDYVDAMIEIGNLYGIPVCPWYYVSGINAKNLTTYTGDGLHPNATGYSRMGRILAQTILNQSSMVLKQVTTSTDEPTPDDPEIIPTGDTVTADGKTFNIADAGSEPYKVIMKLSSSYYLYLSNSPMHTTSTYAEKVKGGCKRITDPGTHIFKASQAVQFAVNNGEYYTGDRARTKDNYVWTNHDITVFGSDEIVLSAETV